MTCIAVWAKSVVHYPSPAKEHTMSPKKKEEKIPSSVARAPSRKSDTDMCFNTTSTTAPRPRGTHTIMAVCGPLCYPANSWQASFLIHTVSLFLLAALFVVSLSLPTPCATMVTQQPLQRTCATSCHFSYY
ncbi:Piso0_000360 [Millerozyma farinosa CBS 7064]|uniref:Piso0_000360 protein n=1 Tax=Pichia sorbitophila (strain ATCC MYA-4447 / BCRC 22081 / CBS 7064 / NBRC 10061 / NRRL Y-12695) TaxID=559304 RepID=G8YV83_PICSO|nr:Piso0_000360 [Millerozyma farinosa CBS 7064]CCE73327.1 Piso0_000360 [Millerozyma farinosa CBS 7064]